jgi:hypothetical protein
MANNKIDSGGLSVSNVANGLVDNLTSNVSGIFSLKPMAKYLSGARCILRINNKIVGFAFSVSWNISTEATEINTIDDYLPYELAPSRISVTGSISGFRIPGSGPTEKLFHADVLNFLHQQYVQIEVKDSTTDNTIFFTNRALITSRSENVPTNDLATILLNFKAIGWRDEKPPELPEDLGKGTSNISGKVQAAMNEIAKKAPLVDNIIKNPITKNISNIS